MFRHFSTWFGEHRTLKCQPVFKQVKSFVENAKLLTDKGIQVLVLVTKGALKLSIKELCPGINAWDE